MRTGTRIRWLMYTLVSAGAVTAWKTAAAYRERQRRKNHGQSRALQPAWFHVKGLRMHARVGSPAASNSESLLVVFVHGWGVSGSYFIPAAERLAVDFPVYVPDLPGHGLSDTPPAPLDIPQLAQALVDWMDQAAIGRAVLIGQSMGCQVAVEAAIRHPQRVERMVLIGLTLDPAGRNTLIQLCRLLLAGAFERPSLAFPVLKDYVRMNRRLIPEYRSMLKDRIEDKLSQVTVPTMLVRGKWDALVPQRWFDNAARRIRAHSTAVIPRWGHAVQFSAPEELIGRIRPFLNQVLL